MKKSYLILLLLIGSFNSVYAQDADQNAISSAGDHNTTSNAQLSWSLGQTVASSSSSNAIFLNEGFHQSEVVAIELGTTPEAQQITIYPNPTVDYIALRSSQKRGSGSYQLASLKGEVLISQVSADFTKENKINMIDFADGVYLLTIKMDGSIKQFKIIKN